MMAPDQFIRDYAAALRSQDWSEVAPLIDEDAVVAFSDGTLHQGVDAIKAAYSRNFALIKNEDFQIENVRWSMRNAKVAAYSFDFRWTGLVDGRPASGSGTGSTVLRNNAGTWMLFAEQLFPPQS